MVWTSQILEHPFSNLCKNLRDFTLCKVVGLCELLVRSAYTSSKTPCCMCWQGCGKVQDWGASSGCCGLFHFATWSFFQPQKHSVFLQLLLWFIGLVNVLAGSESAEQLWSPFLQFEPPWKEMASTGSSCGNMQLQTSSSTKLMQLMQIMDRQVAAWRLETTGALAAVCKRYAAEGIQYAALHSGCRSM